MNYPLTQIDDFRRCVALDTELLTYAEQLRGLLTKLEPIVKERMWLAQENRYLAWDIGSGTVETLIGVLKKLQPPPVCAKNAQVEPVAIKWIEPTEITQPVSEAV